MIKAMDQLNVFFFPQNPSWNLWCVISAHKCCTPPWYVGIADTKDRPVHSLGFCFLQWYANFRRFRVQERSHALQLPGRIVLAQLASLCTLCESGIVLGKYSGKVSSIITIVSLQSEYLCSWYKWALSVFQQNKLKDRSPQLNVLRPCENVRMTEIKFILLTFGTQHKRKKQTLGSLRTFSYSIKTCKENHNIKSLLYNLHEKLGPISTKNYCFSSSTS